MNSPNSPDSLIRSVAESIARRIADQTRPVRSLASVVKLVENDEADEALDDLAHVIEFFRISVHRAEYDQLVAAAQQLDAMDSLTNLNVEQFVAEQP
ncbi:MULTISPECIES: hypothetical protein [unclassified Streptomyces]|uniref:hypothetical protein n=1 Tax=unclassified Streptomyces TaxID=2593676 RepID=UPI002E2AAC46|nr:MULTISPECIES: hypothetical protein [unclassified Streptomyces]